jgi:hypothetical protein
MSTKSGRPFITSLLRAVVSIIMTIIEVILFLRLIFRLFDANSSSGFVRFIYDQSADLIRPFGTFFGDFIIGDRYVLELDTLIIWFIYLLIYVVIIQILNYLDEVLR